MSEQTTLALLKPDLLKKGKKAFFDVINMYLARGLVIVEMREFLMTKKIFNEFYAEHKEKAFFSDLRKTYCGRKGKKFVVLILRGKNAISVVREVNGKTNPLEALPGTIRFLYGSRIDVAKNSVHASDSSDSVIRETGIFRKIGILESLL